MALGLKNVKFEVRFLANDDVATPTALIGKKMAPIFEWKQNDICMGESLDIITLVDGDEQFGPTGLIKPASGRDDLKAWQGSVRDLLRNLQRPRYVATGLLPEFQQLDGRHASPNLSLLYLFMSSFIFRPPVAPFWTTLISLAVSVPSPSFKAYSGPRNCAPTWITCRQCQMYHCTTKWPCNAK